MIERVLMTGDAVGGVWTYALELARALAPFGVEVLLATMGDLPTPAQRDEAAAITNLRLQARELRLEWMAEPWDDVRRASDWLLELEADFAPDAVHLNGYAHGALPFVAPKVVVGHSCVLSWHRAVRGCEAPPAWDRYRAVVTRGVRAADAVVAPTAAMLASLERDYGPLPPAHVIWNGRDASIFTPGEKQPVVLGVGRLWDEAKNLAALDAVAPRLPWPVVVAGDVGDGAPTHVRRIGRLSLAGVAAHMATASIYAHPARYEPFGLAPLEAALAGCALVLGDLPSLREVWGDAAVFVAPDDREALHRAVATLIADPDARAQRAAAARARALAFTPARMAAATLAVYASVVTEWETGACA